MLFFHTLRTIAFKMQRRRCESPPQFDPTSHLSMIFSNVFICFLFLTPPAGAEMTMSDAAHKSD